MQMGADNDLKGKQGKFQCFVAYDLDAENRAQYDARGRGTPGANVPPFFKFLLAEPLRVRPVLAQSTTLTTAMHLRLNQESLVNSGSHLP